MNQWIDRNHKYSLIDESGNFSINFAGMKFQESDLAALTPKFERARREMANLENGAEKNPDEHRKVTHFTDRAAYRRSELFAEVNAFAEALRKGEIVGSTGKKFTSAVINGIGGSALGPQLMQFAINGPYWNELSDAKRNGYLKIYFLDNTDSSGLEDLLQVMEPEKTLVITISKSGGTRETKNNLIALEDVYAEKKLEFAKHAAAITMSGSELDKHARSAKWLRVFEMAESIGGRTSETSIVGHLPAAVAGVDFGAFLDGACAMDAWTRTPNSELNPAYMLAAMWYIAGKGKGDRNMVIVPYSDRLILMSRYLQQLVMESLGKELDLDGQVVHQGLNVFGNKGGTDAHAFIQQLNDGRDDFFVTFIEILKDARNVPVAPGITMGDYLHGFEAGLAAALRSKGRQVISIQMDQVNEENLGKLIALYERAVAVYAEFININAFHQPGVQAYKLAAGEILEFRAKLFDALRKIGKCTGTAAEIAAVTGYSDREVEIAGLLDKAAANCTSGKITRCYEAGKGVIYTIAM